MQNSAGKQAALTLSAAEYGLKKTAWFRGKERTLAELRQMADAPLFPLPPWNYAAWKKEKARKGAEAPESYMDPNVIAARVFKY
jgi:hypothetical protein